MADRRDVFTFGAALVVSLVVGEIAVRLLLAPPGLWRFPAADYGVMAPDSLLGYTYAPNLRRHIVTRDYEVDFATNALGMRDAPLDRGPAPRLRILAVGDSYTQGLGVQAQDSWPERLEALVPGSRVYNTGVSGYSLHQIRLTAERFVPLVRPQLIVVGVYGHGYRRIADPFVLVAGAASPIARSMSAHVRVVPGGVLLPAFETPALRDLGFWVDRHSFFAGHALHLAGQAWHTLRSGNEPGDNERRELDRDALRQAMGPMLDELALLQRYADSAGIPLAGLLMNSQAAGGEFAPEQLAYNAIIADFAARNGMCVVDPVPALVRVAAGRPVLRYKHDSHWNPTGHDVAARELLRALPLAGEACRRAAAVLTDRRE